MTNNLIYSNNYFQKPEYFICDGIHQYLLIPKSGCTCAIRTLENNTIKLEKTFNSKLLNTISWTVLRDPYERFISGLAYDLDVYTQGNFYNYKLIKDIILDKHFFESLFNEPGPFSYQGKYVHYIPQFFYYMAENIDFFVHLEDLTKFISCNFTNQLDSSEQDYSNSLDKSKKEIIAEVINDHPNFRIRLDDFLSFDYFLMDKIQKEGKFWNWNYGKILYLPI